MPKNKLVITIFKDYLDYGGDTNFFISILKFCKHLKTNLILNNIDNNKNINLKEVQLLDKFYINKFVKFKYNKNILDTFINKILYIYLPINLFFLFIEFLLILKKNKPNLVISFNGGYPGSYNALVLCFACKYLNIKNYLFIASLPSKKSLRTIYDTIIDFFIKKSCKYIITNSKYQKRLLSELRLFPKENIKVINNPISINKKNKKNKKNFLNLCTVSRLDKDKKVDVLIKSMINLKDKIKNFKFMIIGSGPELNNLKCLVKKEKLESYVEFLGYLNSNELITKLQSIDIFLFSSTKEGLPFSILEAINYKIPVICNKFNAISNIFKNKKHIIYTKNGNTEEFANLINMLNNKKNMYENIKRNAHKILIKRFNINNINKSFLKLL